MRCPDCQKFVSYDADGDPEVDVRIDDEGAVTGSVRVVNVCAECSSELKAAEFEVNEDFTDEIKAHKEAAPETKHHLDVELEASRTERTASVDRHGKPIKSYRYMKHYYGAEGCIEVTCSCQSKGAEAPVCKADWSDEVQASGMDELV